jgi:hypothetical protein
LCVAGTWPWRPGRCSQRRPCNWLWCPGAMVTGGGAIPGF